MKDSLPSPGWGLCYAWLLPTLALLANWGREALLAGQSPASSHLPPVGLQDQLRFPRMLMKLVSLRTLSSVHSEQVFALRLQDKKLPPLLSEIWDVHE